MGESVQFNLLGPIEIIHNDVNITPTAPKPRQVVSLLLLRRNTVVQTRELIDELWRESPPPSAMTTLQTYIYKLRKILLEHGNGDCLSTRPGGYMLTVPDTMVDLSRFEKEAHEGRLLLESGDSEKAARTLRSALALWRGPALLDVAHGDLLSSYVTRLEELRFRTLELRIEADLRLGHHRETISELKSLVLTHPLHEKLHASLMIALSRSGRRHEALEMYQKLRRTMIEDLGLEPGHDLRELHQSLLSDDFVHPPAEKPLHKHAPQQRRAVEPLTVPPHGTGLSKRTPRGQRPFPTQLPPDLADFTGHTAVLEKITAGLAPGDSGTQPPVTRTVAISGMPGVGKSSLAIRLAHRLRPRFEDGYLYVDLQGAAGTQATIGHVLQQLLQTLGVTPDGLPATLEEQGRMFRSLCSRTRLLMILDGASSTADVRPLLLDAPNCATIITSRRRLHGLIGVWSVEMSPLGRSESVELLRSIVGASRLDRAPRAVERLVNASGGFPPALRSIGDHLAAAPGLRIDEVAEQLLDSSGPPDMLHVGGSDLKSRFDSCYASLNRVDQSAFRLLSMLSPDGFRIGTAAGLLGVDVQDAEHTLERLVDHHLITVSHGDDGQAHYTLPQPLLNYARERLAHTLENSQATAI
ncbi:AfsR/SARP family transcriptional regulator [Thermobifida alba]|uniref:AfsR/SARP family transcriptional regulator n=1 Tax=Thermobifida alba TaxID=53522 RepID=A0ABY4L944_THEAE|nr:AfsR/SARP family transcriptional regulator [Thermobifida alba]